MEIIRTFIAIELDFEIQKYLSSLQDQLKKAGADVKWVNPRNIHLTMKFLGDTPVGKIDAVENVMRDATKKTPIFSIGLTHIGAFPTVDNPRVIWVGIDEGKKESASLALSLEEKLEKVGFQQENREFSAHITIGCVRSPLNRLALCTVIKGLKINEKINQQARRLILFKSTLTSQG